MEAEKKLKMLTMRAEGASIREIAKELGCSFQYIQHELSALCAPRTGYEKYFKGPYSGLYQWIRENKVSINWLSEKLGLCSATVRNKLRGKKEFTVPEIKAIMEITGMSFEEVFSPKQQ